MACQRLGLRWQSGAATPLSTLRSAHEPSKTCARESGVAHHFPPQSMAVCALRSLRTTRQRLAVVATTPLSPARPGIEPVKTFGPRAGYPLPIGFLRNSRFLTGRVMLAGVQGKSSTNRREFRSRPARSVLPVAWANDKINFSSDGKLSLFRACLADHDQREAPAERMQENAARVNAQQIRLLPRPQARENRLPRLGLGQLLLTTRRSCLARTGQASAATVFVSA